MAIQHTGAAGHLCAITGTSIPCFTF